MGRRPNTVQREKDREAQLAAPNQFQQQPRTGSVTAPTPPDAPVTPVVEETMPTSQPNPMEGLTGTPVSPAVEFAERADRRRAELERELDQAPVPDSPVNIDPSALPAGTAVIQPEGGGVQQIDPKTLRTRTLVDAPASLEPSLEVPEGTIEGLPPLRDEAPPALGAAQGVVPEPSPRGVAGPRRERGVGVPRAERGVAAPRRGAQVQAPLTAAARRSLNRLQRGVEAFTAEAQQFERARQQAGGRLITKGGRAFRDPQTFSERQEAQRQQTANPLQEAIEQEWSTVFRELSSRLAGAQTLEEYQQEFDSILGVVGPVASQIQDRVRQDRLRNMPPAVREEFVQREEDKVAEREARRAAQALRIKGLVEQTLEAHKIKKLSPLQAAAAKLKATATALGKEEGKEEAAQKFEAARLKRERATILNREAAEEEAAGNAAEARNKRRRAEILNEEAAKEEAAVAAAPSREKRERGVARERRAGAIDAEREAGLTPAENAAETRKELEETRKNIRLARTAFDSQQRQVNKIQDRITRLKGFTGKAIEEEVARQQALLRDEQTRLDQRRLALERAEGRLGQDDPGFVTDEQAGIPAPVTTVVSPTGAETPEGLAESIVDRLVKGTISREEAVGSATLLDVNLEDFILQQFREDKITKGEASRAAQRAGIKLTD